MFDQQLHYDQNAMRAGATSVARPTSRLMVWFRRDVEESYREGAELPVYHPVDLIEVRQPGEHDVIIRPVRPDDAVRFPREWAAFKADTDQRPDGIPLSQLFKAQPHVIRLMERIGIYTVEMLADLQEAGIQRLGMGARGYVKKAQEFLEVVTSTQGAARLQGKVDEQQSKIEALEQMIRDMKDQMETVSQRARREARAALLTEVGDDE